MTRGEPRPGQGNPLDSTVVRSRHTSLRRRSQGRGIAPADPVLLLLLLFLFHVAIIGGSGSFDGLLLFTSS